MDATLDTSGYAHALGRAEAAWRFASARLRRAAAFATISVIWDIFRRDAGAGDVGPSHETTPSASRLLLSDDPRRDAVLLWLADHSVPTIAEAAATLALMVGAARQFGDTDQALLDAARDALVHPVMTPGSIRKVFSGAAQKDNAVLEPLYALASAIDRLRSNADFLEGEGAEFHYALTSGTFSRYVPAEPAACWALNLALLARGLPQQPPPGQVSRALFSRDLEPDILADRLIDDASTAWTNAYDRLVHLERELARGRDALARLSRNARAREAWLLVVALGACTRTQLARALGLSRAGADIQAHTLADAGLVSLGAGGQISWKRVHGKKDAAPAPLARGPLGEAIADVDASLAEIERLLELAAG